MPNVTKPFEQYCSRPADERFTDLAALKASVHNRRATATERTLELGTNLHIETVEIDMEDGHIPTHSPIIVSGEGRPPAAMTHWAMGQLCQRVKAPADYIRRLPTKLIEDNLNEGLRMVAAEDREIKLLEAPMEDVDGFVQARAVTGPKYGRIWDADVVELVERILDSTGGRFTNPLTWGGERGGLYASDRDCFLFFTDGGSIVDGGSDRDQLSRGFFVWNSEVGNASFGLAAFLFRIVCGNHQLWGVTGYEELRMRHSAGAPDRFASEAAPALLEHVNASVKPLEDMIRKAKAIEVPADETKLIAYGKTGGFSPMEIKSAIAHCRNEEGQELSNLWLLQQGLTAHARDLAYVDARINLERRAGKLMELAA